MSKDSCTAGVVIKMISGRWKISILCHLNNGKKRYCEIKGFRKDISEKMLTQQLKELQSDKLINRKVYAVVPPKVEYSLTPLGKKILPLLKVLNDWGVKHLKCPNSLRPINKTKTTYKDRDLSK
jgi:DNA-binding HxlR family transcriptional regulator